MEYPYIDMASPKTGHFAGDKDFGYTTPIYDDQPQRPADRRRHSSPLAPKRPVSSQPVPKRPATAEDASRHGIPPGYSLKNWDTSEEPTLLVRSWYGFSSVQGEENYQFSRASARAMLLRKNKINMKKAESPKTNYSVGGFMTVAKGSINSKTLDATIDSGASLNTISSTLVEELELPLTSTDRKEITVGSGRTMPSFGSVEVTWLFDKEQESHTITCAVIRNQDCQLMLGGPFLKLTQALGRFKHRVRQIIRPGWLKLANCLSLNLLGDGQERLFGYFNDEPVLAVPDSASDAMFVSESYAKCRNLSVRRGPSSRREVEFYDGSRSFTTGIVKDAQWQFRASGPPIKCDFYVLEYLPVDIILSNSFVHSFDVFSRYEDCLIDVSLCHESEIFGISLIGKYDEELRNLENEYQQDLASEDPFSPEMVKKESARRSEIREKINNLPQEKQASATRDEHERQRQWQEHWERHRQTTNLGLASGSARTAQSQPTPALVPITVLDNQQQTLPNAPRQQRLRTSLLPFRRIWHLRR
ncbi:hypothetical protein F5Y19DRAFT_362346 [Xylariaceae sp. FL1651]|nr:hypothetical protein F5Y19DRAFT_362346 [Xylariaceae sp. FL1651]